MSLTALSLTHSLTHWDDRHHSSPSSRRARHHSRSTSTARNSSLRITCGIWVARSVERARCRSRLNFILTTINDATRCHATQPRRTVKWYINNCSSSRTTIDSCRRRIRCSSSRWTYSWICWPVRNWICWTVSSNYKSTNRTSGICCWASCQRRASATVDIAMLIAQARISSLMLLLERVS